MKSIFCEKKTKKTKQTKRQRKKKKKEKGCLFHKYTAPHLNNSKNTFPKILDPAIEYSQVIKDAEHIPNFQLIFMPPWP